jgi:heat shock protein HslJ
VAEQQTFVVYLDHRNALMKLSPMVLLLLLSAAVASECAKAAPTPPSPQPTPAGSSPVAISAGLPADVVEVTWQWESLVTPVETVKPDQPDRYTIRFERTGRASVRADCNRGGGAYTVTRDRRLSFGPIALTRAACATDSLGDRFARDVGRVSSYFVRDGALFLEMPVDSGTLRFRR